MKKTILIFIISLIFLYCSAQKGLTRLDSASFEAKIFQVYDGDTYSVIINGKRVTIRLAYADTPETKNIYVNEAQPKGDSIKRIVNRMIDDKPVILTPIGTLSYGRLVCKVKIYDTDLGEFLVKNGYAFVLKKSGNNEYVKRLKQLFKEAKDNNLGIFGEDKKPIAPTTWRKKHNNNK